MISVFRPVKKHLNKALAFNYGVPPWAESREVEHVILSEVNKPDDFEERKRQALDAREKLKQVPECCL